MRHVVYAATDADAHLKLAKAVATEDRTPAGAVDDESDEAVEEFEEELGGFGQHPVLPSSSETCTRHRSAGESDAASSLIPADETGDDDDEDQAEEDHAEDDLNETIGIAIQNDDRSQLLSLLKKQVDAFFASDEKPRELQMPSCLTSDERKVLHDHCDRNWPTKRKRSIGPPGDRRIILSNAWSPPANLTAAVAFDAIGDMVAREVTTFGARGFVRGHVGSFSTASGTPEWECVYNDGMRLQLGIDELNRQTRLRFTLDHGGGMAEAGLPNARVTAPLGGSDEMRETLDGLLAGCLSDWATGDWSWLAYDIKHWMTNFAAMCAVDKHSRTYKIFLTCVSDAVFKIMPGEHNRVRAHALRRNSPERVARFRHKYWRRRCRYTVPPPEELVTALYDVYCLFKDLKDPLREGSGFFVGDAWNIFLKEIKYVQQGLLSDLPGVNMYIPMGRTKDGRLKFRCKRGGNAIEGGHLHIRAGQHPGQKGTLSPRTEHARMLLQDFAWDVKAGVTAGIMRGVGHSWLWLADAVVHLLRDQPAEFMPPSLRDDASRPNYLCTDTSVEPVCKRGFLWDEIAAVKDARETTTEKRTSPLLSDEDIDLALQHPELIVEHDAAGLERACGLRTTDAILSNFVDRVVANSLSHTAMLTTGLQALQSRLRRARSAPSETVPPVPQVGYDVRPTPLPLPTQGGRMTIWCCVQLMFL